MRRDNRKLQPIGKLRIWPAVIVNLLLVILLAIAGFFGISAFIVTLLTNALSESQNMAQACASITDEYCNSRLIMAGEAASLLNALDGDDSGNVLFTLQKLSGCDEVGVVSHEGANMRTNALLSDQELSALYDATRTGGGGVYPVSTGLGFTVKTVDSSGFSGVLYLFEHGQLAVSQNAALVWENTDACLLIDATGTPVAYIGSMPDSFDYNAIHDQGLIYTADKAIGRRELLNSGILQGGDAKSLARDVFSSAGFGGGSGQDVTLSLWFENDLSFGGCRLMSHCVGRLDRFQVREILLFTCLSLLVVCLPLFFMIGTVLSRLLYNRGLKRALMYDPVTGGNNFEYFKQQAAALLKRRRSRDRVPAFVVIDVTRFRVFSDIHGSEAGDQLLVRIYNTLQRAIARDELLARYAVDQFSMLLYFDPDEDPSMRVERMLSSLRRLYVGERLAYTAGIYLVSDYSMSVDRMHGFATVAKDSAKHSGGDGLALFTNAMRDRLVGEQQLVSLMDRALKSREFALYLQPKYAVADQRLCGAEALVRWNSRSQGFISPGDFIPLFEKNGFILKLDEYMLAAVADFQRGRLAAGKLVVPISVNISRANFADPTITKRIRGIVDRYGVPHELIELELTESAFFDDKTALLYTVRQLKRADFPISMDDFGSGYSSLNSLKDLPLDVVKLDKAFFDPAGDIKRSEIVIRDTIALAKRLNMTVVAEGIETAEQVRFLQTTSCDLIQGFYFAKPMPAGEYESLVDIPRLT